MLAAGRGGLGGRENPFVPGQGVIPPYLAGRDREQSILSRRLDKLANGTPPGTHLILYGPRGNGKTVLLEWSLRQARERSIDVIDIGLGEADADDSQFRESPILTRWMRALSGASLMGAGIRWRELPPSRTAAVIERRARKKPLLVAVDEAHTLTVKMGRALLSAGQRMQRSGIPAMLLLAGTPDLPRHLNSMHVSFWDRSKRLPIGRLEPVAAGDAIRIPLEDGGRSVAVDALAEAVRESHGYPFFLQLWGELLWDGCPEPSIAISCSDIDRLRPQFWRERNLFYADRYDELDRADLLPVAEGVATEFADKERLTRQQLKRVVRSSLEGEGIASDPRSVTNAIGRLRDLGYVWLVGQESVAYFEPGIPSLMTYVEQNRG